MSIAIRCEECGRAYRLKEELAGKKIKCKECGTSVSIPAINKKSSSLSASHEKSTASSKARNHDPLDDLITDDDPLCDAGKDEDKHQELEPLPRHSRRRRSPAKTPSAKTGETMLRGSEVVSRMADVALRAKPSITRGMLMKVAASLVGVLVVVGLIYRLLPSAGGSGGTVEWKEFSPPNDRFSALLPSAAKVTHDPQFGVSKYSAETPSFTCLVTHHARLPAGAGAMLAELPPKEQAEQLTFMKVGLRGLRLVADRPAILAKRPSHEMSFDDPHGKRLTERSIVVGDEQFTCEFISTSDPPVAELERFFNSFQLRGGKEREKARNH